MSRAIAVFARPRALVVLGLILIVPQPRVDAKETTDFPLVSRQGAAPILIDAADAPVVRIATEMLASDISAVTGKAPDIVETTRDGEGVIVIGTLGASKPIDDLVRRGLVDATGVKGVWEAYRVAAVANAWPGVKRALVVLGADRRGTAYGALSLSRAIGVSPWVWWADVPVVKRAEISVPVETSAVSPSVQYRGIFINDEDWSLRPWAETTFEPERGNIGPKTYERIFALLLRLRANTLWPAMHPGSLAFNQEPRNAELADRYGIVMSASHAEPMLRNNVAEWDSTRWGAFDFATNREAVTQYWEARVKANGRFENFYPLGMRGIHDSPIVVGKELDRVKLLEDVFATQRDLLSKYVSADPTKVPQVFVAYKEVLDLYRRGTNVPSDVTLGWVDDNHGYIRQLSTPDEQKRPGGAGVYYHLSYWGHPSSYLWLGTTSPALVASEMGRAWETNARRLWIANVGDIKPGEITIEHFLDLAWDYRGTSRLSRSDYLIDWSARTFGQDHAAAIAALLEEHFRLAFIRKPEHMDFSHDDVGVQPTLFSPVAYGDEAARRLADYERLLARATALEARMPADFRDAYYQLILYPIASARWMAEKALMADRSYLAAWQGRASADDYAARSHAALKAVRAATVRYNNSAQGKWRNFMNDDPRDQAIFAGLPTGSAIANAEPGLGVAVEGSVDALVRNPARARADYADRVIRWRTVGSKPDVLPAFDRAMRTPHFIDLFNTGKGAFRWVITVDAPWVNLSKKEGMLDADERIWVTIDWPKVPAEASGAMLTITAGQDSYAIQVPLDRNSPAKAKPGTFVSVDGVVAIEAEHFVHKRDRGGLGWRVRPALGRLGAAIATETALNAQIIDAAPYVEYEFVTAYSGNAALTVEALPTFPLDSTRKLRYAVSIDGASAQTVDLDANRPWAVDVVRNARMTTTEWTLKRGARHTLRLWALDPAVVIDRLVLDLGGRRASYLGPPETRIEMNERRGLSSLSFLSEAH
jgi:Glycosyl hydrolase family 115/Gylcosyl hydrolase family 115 C-terminal domain